MDLDMKHTLKKNNLPALTPSKTYYRYAAHEKHGNTLCRPCQRIAKKKLVLRIAAGKKGANPQCDWMKWKETNDFRGVVQRIPKHGGHRMFNTWQEHNGH